MIHCIHSCARDDFFNAVDISAVASEQFNDRVIDEFKQGINNILAFPTVWTPIPFDCRRHLFQTFKYCITYTVHEEDIIVLAVMHNSRNPY